MANVVYDNFVLETRLNQQLDTKLEMLNFVTVDSTLEQEAGMIKKVQVYSASNMGAEEVAEGEGNTKAIELAFTEKSYEVKTSQDRFIYSDEQAMREPSVVDKGISKLAESLRNKISADIYKEFYNATLYETIPASNPNYFTVFVSAIAKMQKEDMDATIFALVNSNTQAKLQIALGDTLKYVEAFARTGYIGSIAGVPLYTCNSPDLKDDNIIIATKSAVKYFRKKNATTPIERVENTRTNTIFGRLVGLAAFENAKECVICAPAMASAATVTTYTAGAKTIAGAAVTGATVVAYVNGVKAGEATAAAGAYSITAAANLVQGDAVKVVVTLKGFVPETVEKTVA